MSFSESILIAVSSNSYAISRISLSDRVHRVSISRFTAVLSQEKEKSRESRSRRTTGNIPRYPFGYSLASFASFAPHGNPSHIILATLSKHSPAASSRVCPRSSNSNTDFQRYISVCHQLTVRTTAGKVISTSSRSRKFANICASI